MTTAVSELRPRRRLEFDPNSELTPLAKEVMAYLVDGDISIAEISERVGWSVPTIWRIRNKPAFQAEYRKQLALVEQQAFDYAISRRVERIAALNDTWLKLKKQIAKSRIPRTDHIYALIALQTAAAKELGQDVQRVQMEITEQVQVIRFEAQEPRAELREQNAIDAEFSEMPADPVTEVWNRALPGITLPSARLDPEHKGAIKRAIAESGADPASVLTPEQFEEIYGEEEQKDPWTV